MISKLSITPRKENPEHRIRIEPSIRASAPPRHSPHCRRRGQVLVEALLAEQPEGVHLALALELREAPVLQLEAAPLLQRMRGLLGHVDAPRAACRGRAGVGVIGWCWMALLNRRTAI